MFEAATEKVCAKKITFDLNGNIVTNIRFEGGCDGNLKAIAKIADGRSIEELEKYFLGNDCKGRGTSCSDQLVKAIRKQYEANIH